ncbi:L-aspartate oxidase [Beijerinckiaceae bacterium RH AL1]|nr:L-aspartate oxidase [Beijerinckiaceae bacterium RH CH11]VVB44154.1 L-aspartate oxidase [Beijerinckiaceae bacterium RH AL8]VVC54183.1 L-aspartate oxidase [Beijerinckiaceae bacterium RH AL1]
MSALSPLANQPVIVGAGLAGLTTALALAPMPCVVLSPAPLGEQASSAWAQGGVAASVGADDAAALHVADTLAAGDGLCDAGAADRILAEAPAAIARLVDLGARFDRDAAGALKLGLEAAHARRRIVHAAGDATGREIMRAVVAAVRACPSITVLEGVVARRLITVDGRIAGVLARNGRTLVLPTSRVVLATGGIGGLFAQSTNPAQCFGMGLALAARAGATLADLEFVQFHPTALDAPGTPIALISEAVRGEGAKLIDETGRRFMADVQGQELAPRDVVARAIFAEIAAGHTVSLDARGLVAGGFATRFPTIAAACHAHGIDPDREPIPVRPAEHYHMGGVDVDAEGRASIEGLWAAGEVARTGLHGANRLASNSLLEAMVCGRTVAASVAATPAREVRAAPVPRVPVAADPTAIRDLVSASLGVLRDRATLLAGIETLLPLARGTSAASDPALVALMIAVAALDRRESRGGHYRTDWPETDPWQARSRRLTLADALRMADYATTRVAAA